MAALQFGAMDLGLPAFPCGIDILEKTTGLVSTSNRRTAVSYSGSVLAHRANALLNNRLDAFVIVRPAARTGTAEGEALSMSVVSPVSDASSTGKVDRYLAMIVREGLRSSESAVRMYLGCLRFTNRQPVVPWQVRTVVHQQARTVVDAIARRRASVSPSVGHAHGHVVVVRLRRSGA
jgi:hypothetical protein